MNFISSTAYKVNPASIQQLNGLLFDECWRNGFRFVGNGAVSEIDLWIDGTHIIESGKRIIAHNLISSLNYFFRIYESSQLVPLSENTLLSEKTSTLISEKLDNSEINLKNQSNIGFMNNAALNSLLEISELRLCNVNRVLIGKLNINFMKNNLNQLRDTVLKYSDILILTEIKLNETFLISQFLMYDFSKPYRFDRNKHGGGVMVYLWDIILSKILEKHSCPNDIECLYRT